MNISELCQVVENHKDTILAAERHIWNNPESGFREWKTHAYMKEQFEALGYSVIEAGNIPGFYADVDTGRPGPKIGIFAEMDSLIVPTHPECDKETGAVHACGHHAQCAAMLGIAAALKAEGALDDLSGSVRLILVPAEEGIELDFRSGLVKDGTIRYTTGKLEFLHRGIMDGVDLSFMVHTAANDKIGCIRGSNGAIMKKATFIGKSAHAGGSPHLGINALYAANLAMNAANSLRETFQEKDTIRFHPIVTAGGGAVNAIPESVSVESYLRGATMESIEKENKKINRAFAGAAAAMGCQLVLQDIFGYAPRNYPSDVFAFAKEAALAVMPEDQVSFTDTWGTGCSDMGDVCMVMPGIHPTAGGAIGKGHGSDYYIADPYLACVVSAKYQITMVYMLLSDGAKRGKELTKDNATKYPTIREYLNSIDKLNFEGQAVSYQEDGTVTLSYNG